MKLKQAQFLKGSREFEIDGDTLFVLIKSFFKEEKLTVDLSTLDPEPVVKGSELKFYVPNRGHSVFSLLVDKPNAEAFNGFVDSLKQTISGGDESDAGIETEIADSAREEGLNRNVYEAPPEFAEHNDNVKVEFEPVIARRLQEDITMLKTYLADNADVKPLIDSLEMLLEEPENEAAFDKVLSDFNFLGIEQGAVITYAPYLKVLVATYNNNI